MSPIRVLFVNDHVGAPGGVSHGGTTYLVNVLSRLPARGVEPTLCILRGHHPAAERLERVGVRPVFFGRAKWDPRALTDLIALVSRERPHVLHVNGMKAHLLGRIAALVTGTPAIVHLHFDYKPRPRALHLALVGTTARLLAVSERLAEHGRRVFGVPAERVEALYNGLALERFADADVRRGPARAALGLATDVPVAAVIGRITIEPDKGHRPLLRAMATVRKRIPDAVLLVVGDGPARPDIEALAGELGLGDAVRFLGHTADVAAPLAAADIAVVPSMCDEALAYVALEAAASGRAVAAFRDGGTPECVRDGETGTLVERGNAAALADAMTALLASPERRARMGEAARRFAGRFSIDRHVDRLAIIHREVGTEPGSARHRRDG